MTRKHLTVAVLLSVVACQGDATSAESIAASTHSTDESASSDTETSSETDEPAADPEPAMVLLHVVSTDATRVGKAAVTIDNVTRYTDAAGFIPFDDLPLDLELLAVRIDAPGFTSAAIRIDLSHNLDVYEEVQLFPLGESLPLDADLGGSVERDGVALEIPPGALVNRFAEPVTGLVDITITSLDPTQAEQLRVLPGPLEARTAQDENAALVSVGMTEVSLWQNGLPVQLAEGATATLTLAIPDELADELVPGQEIPSWSLDLDLGLWVEEDIGTVEMVDGAMVWTTEVSHFTWWNIDRPAQWEDFECYYVMIENADGELVGRGFSMSEAYQGGIFMDGGNSSHATTNVVSNCVQAPRGVSPTLRVDNVESYTIMPNPIIGTAQPGMCRENGVPNANCTEVRVMLAPDEPPVICQLGAYMDCSYPQEWAAYEDIGACEAGKRYCIDNGTAWGGCEGQWTPLFNEMQMPVEDCMTPYDDDCDGSADDLDDAVNCECDAPTTCYSGPLETINVGECSAGTRQCIEGYYSPTCMDEVLPEQEDCETLDTDEDCDGMVSCGPPEAPTDVLLTFARVKQFNLSWTPAPGADVYRVLEKANEEADYVRVGETESTAFTLSNVPLTMRANASYVVQACNGLDVCTDSEPVAVVGSLAEAIGYFKASNTDAFDGFGRRVALSGDGHTLAIGALAESSNAVGIDGDAADNSAVAAGAVYIYTQDPMTQEWSAVPTYVKAFNTDAGDYFGYSVALSEDGHTLAVGASRESSNAAGIDGNAADNSATYAGAVYIYTRDPMTQEWSAMPTYVKASNTDANDFFGWTVALSGDGHTLAVGAYHESSNAVGIDGNATENSASEAGAVYVYTRDPMTQEWSAMPTYVKSSNTDAFDRFGGSVALSGDGHTLVVGAEGEDSSAVGIDGNTADNSATAAGAVYVYTRDPMTQEWSAMPTYVKASNTDAFDGFGGSVAVSGDGHTLVVGAYYEASNAVGIDGNAADNSASHAGAAYVYTRDPMTQEWSAMPTYIKASNTTESHHFGHSVALNADGRTLAVGARLEDSNAVGINGNTADDSADFAGAAFIYTRDPMTQEWSAMPTYVKASNTDAVDIFGCSVKLSSDGHVLAVGAEEEASSAINLGGDQFDNSTSRAGAAYVY